MHSNGDDGLLSRCVRATAARRFRFASSSDHSSRHRATARQLTQPHCFCLSSCSFSPSCLPVLPLQAWLPLCKRAPTGWKAAMCSTNFRCRRIADSRSTRSKSTGENSERMKFQCRQVRTALDTQRRGGERVKATREENQQMCPSRQCTAVCHVQRPHHRSVSLGVVGPSFLPLQALLSSLC